MNIIVGMSGGVDSSVAALLLLEQGHRVTGLFMKNWEEDDDSDYCTAAADLADARNVCERLGIELLTVNFSADYWDRVFENFLAEYRAGRTPNPDILCNREIKFRAFLDHALSLGADAIATGHYARTRMEGDDCWLLRGHDHEKDQSYFLYAVDEAALARSRFPVGELAKSEVRARARAAGLAVHDKKDSTGICFIGERRFSEFLNRWLPASSGEIVDLDGQVLGEHRGLMFHTIGQRHGLGIGGAGDAWYVVAKDMGTNRLYVVQGGNHPALFSHSLGAAAPHWIGSPPQLPLRCQASIRYRGAAAECRVTAEHGVTQVFFDTPQFAVAPGQSVVFYRDERCLGGAIIERADAVDRVLDGAARVAAGRTIR